MAKYKSECVTGGFHSQTASYVKLSRLPELFVWPTIEQTAELPVIWDALTFTYCHYYVTDISWVPERLPRTYPRPWNDRPPRGPLWLWQHLDHRRYAEPEPGGYAASRYCFRWPPCITPLNTLRPTQNDCYFVDDICKWIFVNQNWCILIRISMK